ncbi:MAG: GNAT family N-acetyltransferase [Phycisphaerales bacterium]
MTRCHSENVFPTLGLGWSPPDPIACRIETPRLLIRAYELGDAPEMFEIIRASSDHLLPWMPWSTGHTCVEFTTRYVADQILALGAGEKFTEIGVGIFEKDTGDFIGGTGVHDVRRETASCETGYWVRHDRTGQGYATEACRHIISWALGPQSGGGLGLRRVRIYCSGANGASQKLPERLGLRQEVHQRDDSYIEGIGCTDRLGWGVMADEWDCGTHEIITPAKA